MTQVTTAGRSQPATAGSPHRLNFRPDIEGLRAVAILLVVLAHAKVPWLAGGFVGVDVFFVLSGYLITGLLLREFQAKGRLRLSTFYTRRLQRLLPGLLLMIVCTALAAAVLLAPFEQVPQGLLAATAATWTSNLHFALARLDYFGPTADSNLFLHTWSLGVEEQFYLLWPALLLFLLGAWGWQGRHANYRRLWRGMLAALAICLALCVGLTYIAPQLAFYMVFSRGWQFALGALVFLALDRPEGHARVAGALRHLATPLGWAGLAAILAAAVLLDARTPYPGFWALLPANGTAAVLAAGAAGDPRRGVGALLSLPPMQGIGRVSYAWYLWHWPTLLLGLTVLDPGSPWHVSVLVVLSLVLAVAAYFLVEAPLRRLPALRARPKLALSGGAALMLTTLAASALWIWQAMAWADQPQQARFLEARKDAPRIYRLGCDDWFHSAQLRICQFGPAHALRTVVLIGDSVAAQWFPAVARVFDRPDWRLLVVTKSSCPMVDQPLFNDLIGREFTECAQWRTAAIKQLVAMHPDVVLIGSAYSTPFSRKQWIDGTSAVLASLTRGISRIGVLQPTPVLPFDAPACLARRAWRARFKLPRPDCTAVADDPHWRAVKSALAVSASKFPQVRLINLDANICPGGRCSAQRYGRVLYRDEQHMTASYAASLAGVLASALARAGLDPDAGT